MSPLAHLKHLLGTPLFAAPTVDQSLEEALEQLPRTNPDTVLSNALNFVFFAIGALAIIMIIYSGFQLTTSAGNPGAVARAKNTLVYSIVGLVVAILSYAIVNFVIGEF